MTRTPSPPRSPFLLCVRNDDYPASLEVRKVYRRVPDREAASLGMVRVVDESGEDYLYPADYFVSLPLSKAIKKKIEALA